MVETETSTGTHNKQCHRTKGDAEKGSPPPPLSPSAKIFTLKHIYQQSLGFSSEILPIQLVILCAHKKYYHHSISLQFRAFTTSDTIKYISLKYYAYFEVHKKLYNCLTS